MAKHAKPGDPEKYRRKLVELLEHFETYLKNSELRTQVLKLIPAVALLQNLGASLIQGPNIGSARARILEYMKKYAGTVLSGDELRIVAGISEYARRVRELRVEHGWRILIGIYVLEEDRQAPEHDRKIPEAEYRAVLVRDNYTCRDCGWTHAQWNRSDPRHLEVHHIKRHVDGGSNTADNLTTLCNTCHDTRHRRS